jgi:hypothetical protein
VLLTLYLALGYFVVSDLLQGSTITNLFFGSRPE